MKIKHQLSIATLIMAGVFATGCSQQSAGGSQIAGGSQSQIEGGSQQASSQQQVEEKVVAPVATPRPAPRPAPVAVAPRRPAPVVVRKPYRPPANRWTHTHPAIPHCTKSIRHTHKYSNRNHHHKYGCTQGKRRYAAPRRHYAPKRHYAPRPAQPKVDVYALQRKLKAKGYYKGPIDGVVGPGTRSALKRYMNR